ncbi:hypothetical protein AB0C81_10190 [Streptomyces roseoverticillatus]|uniref:hypothetical protein n=1 Tax=Streptomyces roseoverticillatus TaxID=66429 RepID=UPI0033F196E1
MTALSDDMLFAAFTLVRRSVQDAVRITRGATTPKTKRQPLSLADKVRARIEMHGGRATSSQVLPYVGATAAEVKALPGIVVTVDRSGKTGRPATVFALSSDTSRHPDRQPASADREQNRVASRYAEPQPASAQREENRAPVVQLDAYRPASAPAPPPAPVKRSPGPAPALSDNPFHALL